MKRVLFFVTHPYLGGSQEYIYDLTKELKTCQKYQPIVITLFEGPLIDKLKKNDIKVKILKIGDIFKNIIYNQNFIIKIIKSFLFFFVSLIFILRLIFFIKREKIDLLYNNILRAQILGGITCKLIGLPNIWHVHSAIKKNIFHCLASFLANKIIVLSEKVKKDMINMKICSKEKCVVVYNGVDIEKFTKSINIESIKKEYNIKSDEKVIGIIGSLVSRKGHRYFIEAASFIVKYYKNIKFLIVGEEHCEKKEYSKKLYQLINYLNLSSYFIFTGYQDNSIISIFDILIVPSIAEDFGRVIIEASILKKPIIATDAGGIPEIIVDKETGILVEPQNSIAIAYAVIDLLKDENKMVKLGEAAYKRVVNFFPLQKTKEKIIKIFDEMLN